MPFLISTIGHSAFFTASWQDTKSSGHADIGFIVYPESQNEKVQELLALHSLEEQILFHSPLQLFCRNAHPVLKDPNALTPELFDQYSFVLHSAEAASQISAESSILTESSLLSVRISSPGLPM